MAQETVEKLGRLAEEVENAYIKLGVAQEVVRHLLEEHKTVNPKFRATLDKAAAEYQRRLRKLVRAMDGAK